MKTFFKDLLEYNHHFNQKLADIFIENPNMTSEKAVKLFNHILNAHQIWLNRIEPINNSYGVWEIHDINNCKIIDKSNYTMSLQLLDKYELSKTITYTNSKNQIFNNNIRDILFHINNHATYHRGQIATEFKLNGIEPLNTDYIFYKR
jgi:uncharacterized damage-inducible protein DinB